jgi:hypothetical protein
VLFHRSAPTLDPKSAGRKEVAWTLTAIVVVGIAADSLGHSAGLASWGITLVAWVVAIRMIRDPWRDLRKWMRQHRPPPATS